jgi:hypothetical protein
MSRPSSPPFVNGRRAERALQTQLATMTQARGRAVKAPADIESQLQKRLKDWRQMPGRETSLTRQILQKLLVEKILCRPVVRDGEDAYEITARFHLGRLFEGIICPSGLASPMPASWNQIVSWLCQIDGLRAA